MPQYTAIDSSGNGRHAPFAGAPSDPTLWQQSGPYTGGLKNFSVKYPSFASPAFTFNNGTESVEFWVYLLGSELTGGSGTFGFFLGSSAAGANASAFGVYFGGLNPGRGWTDPQDVAYAAAGSVFNALFSNAFPWNAWRHFAARQSAVNQWDIFLDGVNVGLNVAADGGGNQAVRIGGSATASGGNILPCYMAGVAIHNTILSDGQIAAHYAARTSNAAYRTAVLADDPEALWMLDEPGTGWHVGQIGMSA